LDRNKEQRTKNKEQRTKNKLGLIEEREVKENLFFESQEEGFEENSKNGKGPRGRTDG